MKKVNGMIKAYKRGIYIYITGAVAAAAIFTMGRRDVCMA
jgi:hypothetical protein